MVDDVSVWTRQATCRQLAALAAIAIAILAATSFGVWSQRPGDRKTTTEANVYFAFADKVVQGAVPYRDVSIEYPPGALPVFLAPTRLLGDTTGAEWESEALNTEARRYEVSLAVILAFLLAITTAVTAASLRLLSATVGHSVVALGVLASSPLLLGALPLTRYDAWPVLLTSLGVLAALATRSTLAGAVLGAAATAKLYSVVLLPVLVVRAWRDKGRRAAMSVLGGAAIAAAVVVTPFFLLAPSETIDSIRLQLSRGLQMESLGGSLLAAAWKVSLSLDAHGIGPGPLPVNSCQRCDGLVAAQLTGTLASVVGLLSSLAVVAVVVVAARRASHSDETQVALVLGAAISVTALVVVGKVLSAQFLLWLLPIVPLVAGRRGRRATGVLVVAAVMTNVWFPGLYRDYVNVLAPGPIAFLLVRNALLVAVLAILLWPESRSSSGAEGPLRVLP